MALSKKYCLFTLLSLLIYEGEARAESSIVCYNKNLKEKIFNDIKILEIYKWDALEKNLDTEVIFESQKCLENKFPEILAINVFRDMHKITDNIQYFPASNWGYGYIFSDKKLKVPANQENIYPKFRIVKYSFSINYEGQSMVNETFMMKKNENMKWDFFSSDNFSDFVPVDRNKCLVCHSSVSHRDFLFTADLLDVRSSER